MKNWILIISLILNISLIVYTTIPDKKVVIEANASEIRQKDSSLVLERKSDTIITYVEVPGKDKIIRQEKILVKTMKDSLTDTCKDAKVIITTVKESDNSTRVIATAENGKIISGVDIPVEASIVLPKTSKWSMGLLYDPLQQSFGGYVDKDFGKLRVGGQIISKTIILKAGLDF